MSTYPAVEQGRGGTARRLRANRLRIALAVGAVESVAVAFTSLTRWSALALAAVIFILHFWRGRRARSETVRQLSWTAAGSQVVPVLVAAAIIVVSAVFVIAVIVLAVVIGAMLLLDRK